MIIKMNAQTAVNETIGRPLTKQEIRSEKVSREEFPQLHRNPIYLVLDSLMCAHNVGTIIRLSDALLVEKVFICGDGPLPPSKKVRKGSLGAERWVAWEHREDTFATVSELKSKGIWIITAEIATTSIDYRNADYQFPRAWYWGGRTGEWLRILWQSLMPLCTCPCTAWSIPSTFRPLPLCCFMTWLGCWNAVCVNDAEENQVGEGKYF
jgi:hypothetical protein